MFNSLTKVVLFAMILSVILNLFQLVTNSKLETSLSTERGRVTALVEDNYRLEQNEKYSKSICKAEQEALQNKIKKMEEIRGSLCTAKESLNKIREGENNNAKPKNTDRNIGYGPDVARVLNRACSEIFGQDCPNPK